MAVVEGYLTVTSGSWLNVTPALVGNEVTLISMADKDHAIVFRAGSSGSPPDDENLEGQPLKPGEGFEKKDIGLLTFEASPDAVFVRTRSGSSQIWRGFLDAN